MTDVKTMPCFLNSVHCLLLWRNKVLKTTPAPSSIHRCRGTYSYIYKETKSTLHSRKHHYHSVTKCMHIFKLKHKYWVYITILPVVLSGGTTKDSYPKMRTMSVTNHKLLQDATLMKVNVSYAPQVIAQWRCCVTYMILVTSFQNYGCNLGQTNNSKRRKHSLP